MFMTDNVPQMHVYCQSDAIFSFFNRVMRQIFQSLPPILDMMLLLFYFLLIFSILGKLLHLWQELLQKKCRFFVVNEWWDFYAKWLLVIVK